MTDPTPTPTAADDLLKEANALYSEAEAACDRTLRYYQGRVARAAWFLEAMAGGFVFAVIPTLAVATAVILIATTDRSPPAVISVMVFGVFTALVLSGLLGGFAAHLRVSADQADALGRIADALEDRSRDRQATPPAATPPASNAPEIRQVIRSRLWDDASALVQTFADNHPGDPDAPRLAAELAEARRVAKEELLARIEAARGVNEPERVIELRDELKPLIEADALGALDRDLAKWFLLLIHRRLRSGTIRPDLAALVGRVAESLDGTPEGASLRASLPTLRRAAGLCARCARPYKGIADACPACLSGGPAPTSTSTPPSEPEPDDDDMDREADLLDLNDPRIIE